MPNSVRYALLAIWLELLVGPAVSYIYHMQGKIHNGMMIFTLATTMILAIVPYRISKQSNFFRLVWLIHLAVGIISRLVIPQTSSSLQIPIVGSWYPLPFDLISVYFLYAKESNVWFTKKVTPIKA